MKKETPVLSIIVPCFNAEMYIRRTLKKLININLNKEIIVINDGSTDNSLKILREFSEKIVLVNLERNFGVSHARNKGMEVASGKYLSFIDVDDDFETEMHSKMLDTMIMDKSDLCICNNDIIELDNNIIESRYDLNFEGTNQSEVICKYLIDKIFPTVCASIYKTDIAKQVKFNENLSIGEDILFVLRYLLKSKKTSFINESLYHYVQHQDSSMHLLTPKMIMYLNVPNLLNEKERNLLEMQYEREFNYFKLEMIQRSVNAISISCNVNNKKEAIHLLKKCVNKKRSLDIIRNKFTPKHIKLEFFVLFLFGIRIHLFVFPLYKILKHRFRRTRC